MQKQLSPKKYILEKGRNLPFHEQWVNENWQETGMASVLISKKMPSGNFIVALYLVDLLEKGVKDTFYRFNQTPDEYEKMKVKFTNPEFEKQHISLNLAHNIIYAGIDFAAELGIQPHRDFHLTQYLLDENLIDDGIDDINCGFLMH